MPSATCASASFQGLPPSKTSHASSSNLRRFMIAAARRSTRARASGLVRLQCSKAAVATSRAMSASRSVAAAVRPTTCDGLAGLTETISPSVSIFLPPMMAGGSLPSLPSTSFMAARIFSTFLSSDQSRYSSFLYGMRPMVLLSLDGAGYAPDHVLGDVAGYLRVLLQAAGRVLVPVLPEGHVDPELVARAHEDSPELLVDAEQHLELVAVLRDLELVDEPEGVPDQVLVVRRDTYVHAPLEQLVEQEDVVLPDGVKVLVGHGARLVVDALAQPDGEARLDNVLHVLQAAAHVRLQDGPRVRVDPVRIVDDLQGLVRVGGVLHVHPDEAAPDPRVLDDLLDVGPAQLLVEGEAEARELYGDAAREVVLVEGVHDLFVVFELAGGVGLALGALPEQVDGDDAALAVQFADRLDGLIQRVAGDVAARDLLDDGPRYDGHRIRYGPVHYSHAHKPRSASDIQPPLYPDST